MKYTTPETRIFTREQFDEVIRELCGAKDKTVRASQNLSLAWGILQHCKREGGELWEKMVRLLPPDELWALAPSDAAHAICNAFHEAKTGADVEIEDFEE